MSANRKRRMRLAALAPLPLVRLLAEATGPVVPAQVDDVEIECTPINEIVAGYCRWLTLRKQDVANDAVVIRDDLADLSQDEIGLHALRGFLQEIGADDTLRSQLFRIWDVWRKTLPRKGRRVARREELDDRIQTIIGVSRRTLLRHRVILLLDFPDRELISSLKLPNWATQRIACLGLQARKELMNALRATTDPRAVLEHYFPDVKDRRHRKVGDALASFVRNLKRGMVDLDGRHAELGRLSPNAAATLWEARDVIDRLLAQDSEGHQ